MSKKIKEIKQEPVSTGEVINQELAATFDERMGVYSASVLSDRALSYLSGCKPVNVRYLWCMHQNRLTSNKPHVKSLKLAGEVIGKFHPHSADSVYGAMVTSAQYFRYSMPLIDGFGNWGSQKTANSEAASRYSEARLSLYAEKMLEYIDKDTATMIDTFSGEEQMPIDIPTIMPNILINPNFGIAVGYSSSWPTGNIQEVLAANIFRIKNPTSILKGVMKYMPAPDFPTGGKILNYQGVIDAYKTGQGKITVRGDVEKDENKHLIIIKSLPYGIYIDDFLHELDECLDKNIGINDFTDKSVVQENGSLYNINIEIKCDKKADLNFIENYLYKNTSLQTNFNANLMAIIDNKPVLCNLLLVLDKLIESQHSILIKAYTYDLNKALARKEIVEGLLKATKDKSVLDKIIKLIRSSKTKDEAKQKLMSEFNFTEPQAIAILMLRLQALVNTDIVALEEELIELKKTIDICNKVINDKKYREEVLINKLKEYQKLFPSKRKTVVDTDVSHTGDINIKVEELIPEGNKIILLSKQGFIKSTSEKSFNSSEHWTSALNLGLQDQIVTQAVVDNKDNLVALSSLGRALPIKVFKLKESPMKANALSLSDKFDVLLPNETVVFGLSQKPETDSVILFVSKHGQIKLMNFSSIPLTRQKWTEVMKLKNGDQIIFAGKCNPKTDNVCIVSKNGQILSFSLKDITIQRKSSGGMAGQKLKKNDEAISAFAFNPKAKAAMLVSTPNEAKWLPISEIPIGNRATQGVKVSPEKSMNIIGAVKLALPANKTQYIQAINNNDQTSWLLLENIPQKKLDQKMVKMTTGNLKSITVLENVRNKKEEK